MSEEGQEEEQKLGRVSLDLQLPSLLLSDRAGRHEKKQAVLEEVFDYQGAASGGERKKEDASDA